LEQRLKKIAGTPLAIGCLHIILHEHTVGVTRSSPAGDVLIVIERGGSPVQIFVQSIVAPIESHVATARDDIGFFAIPEFIVNETIGVLRAGWCRLRC
jgi:hypothetical protein